MLTTCRGRRVPAPLARAVGESLPLRDASIAGCRIERVLQHVPEPARVIAEVARCLRPGGIVTVFEPDWTSLRIASDFVDPSMGWLYGVASPDAGVAAASLLEAVGFEVLDLVSERSFVTSLAGYERVLPLAPSTSLAVRDGRIDADTAYRWQREQKQRDRDGRFSAEYTKILTVASRRAS
jgi:SAM-dependent methyltransferase